MCGNATRFWLLRKPPQHLINGQTLACYHLFAAVTALYNIQRRLGNTKTLCHQHYAPVIGAVLDRRRGHGYLNC